MYVARVYYQLDPNDFKRKCVFCKNAVLSSFQKKRGALKFSAKKGKKGVSTSLLDGVDLKAVFSRSKVVETF